jgi:catechol 2,3-dioxygenase-like lactoylglutathione lyase family enzyme
MFKIVSTHISTDVANLDEAREYLEDVLGLEKLRELSREDIGTIVWYPGLELRQADSNAKTGLVKHVAWQVDDIQEAIRLLKKKGVTFETEGPCQIDVCYLDPKEIVHYIFFKTPVGLQGELYQVGPPEMDRKE